MAEPTQEERDEYREWVQSRPPALREIMRRIPPMAIVRAKPEQRLLCPAPGQRGAVVKYDEHDDGHFTVAVAPLIPDGDVAARLAYATMMLSGAGYADCDPDWLEVVEEESARAIELFQEADGG